jgi:large subunit ribosomal protein L9
MDVILIENVQNLGKVGELIKVKDGYARNFLLPKKLAVLATTDNLKQFEHQKRLVAQRMEKMRKSASDLKTRLEGFTCTVARQVGEEDKLFGSVQAKDIAEVLQDAGYDVDRKSIQLDAPIKTAGTFQVVVKLYQDVTATLKVWVVAKNAE